MNSHVQLSSSHEVNPFCPQGGDLQEVVIQNVATYICHTPTRSGMSTVGPILRGSISSPTIIPTPQTGVLSDSLILGFLLLLIGFCWLGLGFILGMLGIAWRRM